MSTHRLKTWPEFFAAVRRGDKTFEVRYDDRRFKVGDTLVLEEWVPTSVVPGAPGAPGAPFALLGVATAGEYTGQRELRVVGYVMQERAGFGLEKGYVVLGFAHSHEVPLESDVWDDKPDEWTAEIDAAFPTRSGSHDEYAVAMQMIGHRRSKTALVALVNWLLVRLRETTKRAQESVLE